MTLAPDTASAAEADPRPDLVGLDREELARAVGALGEPERALRMRANQLWHWIYYRGVRDFAAMTTISKHLRAKLAEHYRIGRPDAVTDLTSRDRSRKWLFALADGAEIETVQIPEEDRGALCVSSQVGCTLNCSFCHTGTQSWVRDLTAGEIVGQVMAARDAIGEWPSPADERMISNIVMMGMGEPLYNYDNVAKAIGIMMDAEGISISRRRITLSTAGVVPMMERCGAELGVNLAVSLHAVTDEVRDELVPLNRKYPIAELLEACRTYPSGANSRRITFEYAMLKGINDSKADAKRLAQLLAGIPAKVNLIPFNPWPGTAYERSTDAAITAFAEIVNRAGYSAPVRVPRGEDIMAACGQLKSASVRERKSARC